jgi:hypothetical protein
MTGCVASHDGHDCGESNACRRALVAMMDRMAERERADRADRDRTGTVPLVWPNNPKWVPA